MKKKGPSQTCPNDATEENQVMQPPPNRPIHNEKSETVIKAMQIVFVAELVRKDI